MAVKYNKLKGNRALITCLSSDAKPIATEGFLLIEEDTADIYYVVTGAWVLKSGGGGLTQAQVKRISYLTNY